jgi:hypothetical protein
MTTRPRVVVAGTLPAVGVGLLEERFVVEIGGVPADAGVAAGACAGRGGDRG